MVADKAGSHPGQPGGSKLLREETGLDSRANAEDGWPGSMGDSGLALTRSTGSGVDQGCKMLSVESRSQDKRGDGMSVRWSPNAFIRWLCKLTSRQPLVKGPPSLPKASLHPLEPHRLEAA